MHRTVLLKEVIDGLLARRSLGEGGNGLVILDATFGGGGHSAEIRRRYKDVKIIAIDQDESVKSLAGITLVNANFRDLDQVLLREGVEEVDGIIFDLGLSSDQLSPPAGGSGRGFSFLRDEPLLMTYVTKPKEADLTAKDVVNDWSEESLRDIIRGYGEEKFAGRIARAIVEAREKGEIKTTLELVKIIEGAVPEFYRRSRIHFATRTFQAIRIAVNDELGAVKLGIMKGFEALKVGGRMAVISFHSLEDRIVKRFYKEKEGEQRAILINKKPIIAGEEELKINPRARSAKLRILSRQ